MSWKTKRDYQLPGISDLSREQETIHYLPLDGRYLIVGGPGTGKTIVAILRAQLLAEQKKRYRFFVFNRTLETANRQLYKKLESKTWVSWVYKWYQSRFKENIPKIGDGYQDIDWNEIISKIEESEFSETDLASTYIVIDEGQDMPVEFYDMLYSLGAQNIFVTADQNQQLDEHHNSTIQEIAEALDLEGEDIYRLTENFRQKDKGFYIAKLADTFCTDDPGSTRPKLPDVAKSTETPFLYYYNNTKAKNLEYITERIIQFSLNHPSHLIGVFTHNDETRRRYLRLFERACQKLSASIRLMTYSGKEPWTERKKMLGNLRFDHGGIVVINAQSCKGLEFDTVFIADIHEFQIFHNSDQTQKLFYVMSSRAQKRLYLLCDKKKNCSVEKILPEDPAILKRNI